MIVPIDELIAASVEAAWDLDWGTSFASERVYKLDLGCGQNKCGQGWTGIDTHEAADIQAPMWAVPLPDACADELYSSHALEHVMKAQVIPTLKEWRRLAREDATLTLRIPDLAWCVRNWLATGMGNGWELDTIFGSQEHDGNCHRTGFTAKMMEFYLVQSGWVPMSFRTIESHGQPTLEFICKPMWVADAR